MGRKSRPGLGAYLLVLVVGLVVAAVVVYGLYWYAAREPLTWRTPRAFWLGLGCMVCLWAAITLGQLRSPVLGFSSGAMLRHIRRGWVARLAYLPVALRISALALMTVALARPQTYRTESLEVEGIDIVVAFDLSQSMEEVESDKSRLEIAKNTVRRFVGQRSNDRVGLVVFAEAAMVRCPLTLDYGAFQAILADLEIGDVPAMGTAVGDAIGLSLAYLRRSAARSKVVVVVSDGEANVATEMGPSEAKRAAALLGVRVFTILMGKGGDGTTTGDKRYPVNAELLAEIAHDTGGLFFTAGDDQALAAAFEQVRANLDLTRQRIAGQMPSKELFVPVLAFALFLLLLELILVMTRWRRFP